MAMSCPNCGGLVHFDVADGKLHCDYCDSVFAVEEYKERTGAQEIEGFGEPAEAASDDWQVMHYICRNCGAEILAGENSVVGYCTYCGGEATLDGKMDNVTRPKTLIPFTIDKQTCKDRYRRIARRTPYLPRELKDPAYLDRFRGTYVPYWEHEVTIDNTAQIRTVKYEQTRKDLFRTTYELDVQVNARFDGVPMDASSCFDDTIAAKLAPYDRAQSVPFSPAYLAGFYADRADVDDREYADGILHQAADTAFQYAKDQLAAGSETLQIGGKSKRMRLMEPEITEQRVKLLPVWFLTWRKGDRVAYTTMNGQTGKIVADFPVDIRSFSLGTMVLAAALFALLTLFMSTTARGALEVCAAIGVLAMIIFCMQAWDICDRENHLHDPGYFAHGAEVTMPASVRHQVLDKLTPKKERILLRVVPMVVVFLLFLLLPRPSEYLLPAQTLQLAMVMLTVVGVAVTALTFTILRYVDDHTMRAVSVVGAVGLLVALVVAFVNPVADIWYYVAALVSIAGALVMSLSLVRYYNLLATRPLPNFFNREGGRDHAND